tara:strand:- start:6 stop:350 length:345 start_codon:yes stop_codon:yes gene_type:complete
MAELNLKAVLFFSVFSVFCLVVFMLVNCKNSKLELKKNMGNNVIVLVILSVLGILVYNNNRDYFSEKCCPPKGVSALVEPECKGDKVPKDGGCGAFVRGGSARCMAENTAFSCT